MGVRVGRPPWSPRNLLLDQERRGPYGADAEPVQGFLAAVNGMSPGGDRRRGTHYGGRRWVLAWGWGKPRPAPPPCPRAVMGTVPHIPPQKGPQGWFVHPV